MPDNKFQKHSTFRRVDKFPGDDGQKSRTKLIENVLIVAFERVLSKC
jgi:hypothetical protein